MEEIRENPCLQYFLGFPAYSNIRPFDPSVMTWFRERITPQMLSEVNDHIIGRKSVQDDAGGTSPSDNGSEDEDDPGMGSKATTRVRPCLLLQCNQASSAVISVSCQSFNATALCKGKRIVPSWFTPRIR